MADTTLSFIHGSDLIVDAAFVSVVGSTPTVNLTTALASVADAAVQNSDTVLLATRECSLIDTATGTTYSFIPEYDGDLTRASMVLDGATTAVGACSVAITIGGVAVVLSGALSFTALSASGASVSRTVSSAGAFTAGQVIRLTTTSANTAATFGTVSLGATRA